MKKVAFHTLGCKLNFAETSTLGRQFLDHGFDVVDPGQPADVVLLNTCSVTERADAECRQIIRRSLRRSPNAYIIVVGCYAQLQPEEIADIDGVDLILGTREKFRIFEHEQEFAKRSAPQTRVSCIDEVSSFDGAFSADVGGRTRAFLKVQDGCDFQCSFCTIPLARGRSRSQPLAAILDQARLLVDRGFKEIVLTGVNVGDYGSKIGLQLLTLLEALEHIDGIKRIRVSSVEPNLMTPELIDCILGSEKFCNHFHLPLQSGSNVVLKRMRRRYRREDYASLVHYIKSHDPAAGIGADVIVGFPGETDAHFLETYRFLEDLPVTYLHAFTYSEREQTAAEALDGAVEPKVRFRRNEMLRTLSASKRLAFASSFCGSILPVLFEGNYCDGRISGLTSNYLRVEVNGDTSRINSLHPVRIVKVYHDICHGEIISNHLQRKGNCVSELCTDQRIDYDALPQHRGGP